ncbi:MAG TPA: alkaline phosphatase family protein [Acidimicrobiales bacterium]|nr:alkaline phosphatase family protein [Acidimicrobiales bacterium]
MPHSNANALDHVVVVLFENRSFDNLLGRLYEPGEVPSFEGVTDRRLTNPVPSWAEHTSEDGAVAYHVAAGMDSPDPDPGEEYQHTNTQLFGVLDEANRFKDATEMVPPYNAPAPGQQPTMDGFVTDYISFFTREVGRQPTYQEYSQIMTGYTPQQVPVLSSLARGFCVFDHWFSEVPSQTLANRSFWTAATSSGFVVNRPMLHFTRHNNAETIFDRLERFGMTWKVYVLEPDPVSFTGLIHMPRLEKYFRTNFVPFAQFERDAANGTLPNFSLIEPNLLSGHGDYHPAFGRALLPGTDVPLDPPSSVLAGEGFLARLYNACRSARSSSGSNVFNTALLIGFDEPGGTYDHVAPGPVPPPDPPSSVGQLGFKFDRSGYRTPAVLVSPWVPNLVATEEYRHTSLLATLREAWGLGAPFSERDAAARTFRHLLALEEPRDPATWPDVSPQAVPRFQLERVGAGEAIGTLGKHVAEGMLERAPLHRLLRRLAPADDNGKISPRFALAVVHLVAKHYFPRLSQPKCSRARALRTIAQELLRNARRASARRRLSPTPRPNEPADQGPLTGLPGEVSSSGRGP